MTDLSHFRYRDREGDIWEHLPNNNFRLAVSDNHPFAVGMELSAARLREKYGPLTHISTEETPMSPSPGDQFRDRDSEDAPAESYRDNDGDTWYRLPNGRYTLRAPHERTGDEHGTPLVAIRRVWGPLTAVAETSPSPREDAYKRARELVAQTRESGMSATAEDVLRLAEFLSA